MSSLELPSGQDYLVDLDNLSDVLWHDLHTIRRSETRHLQWTQVEHEPWWAKLNHDTEEKARRDCEIESEDEIRDYRKLVAETKHFDITFYQGPLLRRTIPQRFNETLGFALKKAAWENQIDYSSSPKFMFDRGVVSKGYINMELISESVMDGDLRGPCRKERIHEIPEAEREGNGHRLRPSGSGFVVAVGVPGAGIREPRSRRHRRTAGRHRRRPPHRAG